MLKDPTKQYKKIKKKIITIIIVINIIIIIAEGNVITYIKKKNL